MDNLVKTSKGSLFVGILAIIVGIIFIAMQSVNEPIPRSQAVSYSGEFSEYEVSKNYCSINFKDGTVYEVYPHTETGEFRDKMESLPKGTMLYILVNPNNDCVVEVATAKEELLNFEKSQQDIDSYDNGYIAIGAFSCIAGVGLIIFALLMKKNKGIEEQHANKIKQQTAGLQINSEALRHADMDIKSKILLEAQAKQYHICYRRVKAVNELVVNGVVYDEKRAIIEFSHKLFAIIDHHRIEAGLDENSNSYIKFDGKIINYKERMI